MSPEWSYTMDQSRLSNISGTTYWMALFFFTLLFGSELFEDYIGHLAMATMASTEMTTDNDNP